MTDRESGTIEPMTETEGGALLEGLLFRSPEDKSSPREKQKGQSTDDESDDESTESDENTEQESEEEDGDEPKASDEDAAESDEDDADEGEAEEPNLEAKYTVKVDGAEEAVTLKEALAGYSRTAHFTRNSQKLSKEKQDFEAEKTAVTAERKQYAELLGKFEEHVKNLVQEPDWDKLRREDPDGYLLEKDAWEQQQKRLTTIAAERQKTEAKLADENKAAFVQHLQKEHVALLDAIPEWKEEAKFNPEFKALKEYALENGFSEDDFNNISSHRVVVMLRKAMKFDKAKGKAPPVKKASTTPTIKPGTRPPKGKSTKATKLQAAKSKLAKSGDMSDAAEVLGSLLFPE
jgi:hypothetical protein